MTDHNRTLLNRPYVATWWETTAVVVLVVAAAGFVRASAHAPARPRVEE